VRFTLLAGRDPFLADYVAAHRERIEKEELS
jgi:hypothetical protein